jgi:2',3'-cyclic-nucleotide 2'-phosphodiesterase/3'-nucleotidase
MTAKPGRRQIMQAGAALGAATMITGAAGANLKLRLLETSDIHTFDEDYDYFRDQPDESVGLTKIATLIRAARGQVKNCLLFDNGDIIQGNPLADYVALPGNFPGDGVHPTIAVMNLLAYDAATVGNHEFNYGLPFFDAALAGAKFPFCAANFEHADGSPYLKPYLILERTFVDDAGQAQNLKIGVIGFVTPQIVDWDKAHLNGKVRTADIVEAARKYVPELRKQADIVIALSHSGINVFPRRGGEENASFYLSEVPGIDVIFTGHSHRVFPGPDYAGMNGIDAARGTLNGIPAVMPGFWGSHLGVIDLTLSKTPAGWIIVDFSCAARPIAVRNGASVTALVANDPAVDAALAPAHNKTLAWIRQPVGRLAQKVNSYAALIGDDSSLALVNAAQIWYARPLLAGTPAAGLPLLSAAAPFKEGYQSPDNFVDLAAGGIAIKDVADLYMYPNTVCAVAVNGAQLREWLEHSAQLFNRIDINNPEPQPLLNPRVPSYVFDVIAGITYEIDISAPARYGAHGKFNPNGRRIVNLRYQGETVAQDQMFVVVTNNYRADSGGVVPKDDPDAVILRAPDQIRDVIVRYILQNKVINVAVPPVWSFARFGAPVVVTFESAPAAAATLLAMPGVIRQPDNGDGYAVYALNLS